MKKIVLSVLAVFMAVFVSACSCGGAPAYSFVANWQKNKVYSNTFSETSTYDVNFLSDFTETTGKITYNYKTTPNKFIDCTYSKGVYTVKVEATKNIPTNIIETAMVGDFYKLTTSLTLPVTYAVKADATKTYSFIDTVTSTVYFKSEASSLAPIYSEKFYDTTSLNEAVINRYSYSTSILWDKKAQLTMTDKTELITNNTTPSDNYKISKIENLTKNIKYTEGTVLDNEELLFALRGLAFSEKYSASFKVLDTAYQSAQPVSVACSKVSILSSPWTLKLNDKEPIVTAKTPTYLVTVGRADTTYSGSPKLCYYQAMEYSGEDTEVTTDKNARAFLVRFVDKLPNSLGALEYLLNNTVVKN